MARAVYRRASQNHRTRLRSVIEKLEEQLVLLGYKKGSRAFKSELLKEKVLLCMSTRGHDSCTACEMFTHCNLRLAHWRDVALGPEYVDDLDKGFMEEPDEDF